MGTKSFYAKKELVIYFDNEYNLEKAIEHDAKKHNVSSSRFFVTNFKQIRIAEADQSIRVTNIPLDTKSDIIRYYFEKYRKITKFFINTYNEWQTAYITFESKDNIITFYESWAILIMDYMIKVFPQNLD